MPMIFVYRGEKYFPLDSLLRASLTLRDYSKVCRLYKTQISDVENNFHLKILEVTPCRRSTSPERPGGWLSLLVCSHPLWLWLKVLAEELWVVSPIPAGPCW